MRNWLFLAVVFAIVVGLFASAAIVKGCKKPDLVPVTVEETRTGILVEQAEEQAPAVVIAAEALSAERAKPLPTRAPSTKGDYRALADRWSDAGF